MCRSKLKGPFIKKTALSKNDKVIVNRSVEIVPKFVGFNFSIYNGKNFFSLTVKEKMIGHKFGEFCFTKFKSYGTKN
jgi:small subunit ribosomal protein S19